MNIHVHVHCNYYHLLTQIFFIDWDSTNSGDNPIFFSFWLCLNDIYVITCNLWLVNFFFYDRGSGKETRLHFLTLLLNKTIQFMLHQTFFWHFSSPIKNTNVCMYAYLLSLCLTCVSYKVFTLPLYKYILRGLSHAMNKQQETSQHLYLYTRMFPVCFYNGLSPIQCRRRTPKRPELKLSPSF